jgi:hypothetical protein
MTFAGFSPIIRWKALPKAARRTVIIALVLNEVRGIAVVAFVLLTGHKVLGF